MLTNTLLLCITQEALTRVRDRFGANRRDDDATPDNVVPIQYSRRRATYWRADKIEQHRQAALRN
ncbi:MAG: hypothetical protein ACK4FJ_18245 [Ferrovibrio sp.]|uniref:hypothetical protein n=1 Tax=Ferrovibrio sp. TaxID=1917215 RepID=UPI00391A53E7